MEIKKVLTICAYVVAALIAFKIVTEVLSFVFASGWLILAAVAVWFFLIKDRKTSNS